MAAEAGKLIALSMGKIAESRRQRGGINLCKNLLVSTVLFKARNIYMMENYQQIAEARKQRSENKSTITSESKTESVKVQEKSSEKSISDLPVTRTQSDLSEKESRVTDNKENILPENAQELNEKCEEKSAILDINKGYIKNNEDKTETLLEKNKNICQKCTKRRRSEVGVIVNNSTKSRNDDSGSPHKKLRIEKSTPKEDRVPDLPTSKTEPMVTEPPQISNLVHIFSSGFAGLCNSEQSQTTHQEQQYSTAQSCIKQVSSFVENLSRPVIALTV